MTERGAAREGPPSVHETLRIEAAPDEVYHHAMAVGHCAPFLPTWLHVVIHGVDVAVQARLGPLGRRWHARLDLAGAPARVAWQADGHQGEARLHGPVRGPTRLEVRIWSSVPWSEQALGHLRRGLAAFAAHVEQQRLAGLVHEGAHSH